MLKNDEKSENGIVANVYENKKKFNKLDSGIKPASRSVAQRLERRPYKSMVGGSIPPTPILGLIKDS